MNPLGLVQSIKKKRVFILLFLLWLQWSFVHFCWLSRDNGPPSGNGIPSMLQGMALANMRNCTEWSTFIYNAIRGGLDQPPLVDISYFVYYRIFGVHSRYESMTGILYFALALWGIYGIGKELFNEKAGVLAAIVFSGIQAVMFYAKTGFTSYHLMCVYALCLYFLYASKNLSKRMFSLLFGIACGLLMAIRIEGVVFLVVPGLSIVYSFFTKEHCAKWWERIINGVYACAAFLIVSSSWYICNSWRIFEHYWKHRFSASAHDPISVVVSEPFFYIKYIFLSHIRGYVTALLVFALLFWVFQKVITRKKSLFTDNFGVLFMTFIFPLVFYSAVGMKNASHTLPLLVIISVVAGAVVAMLKNALIRGMCVLVIVIDVLLAQCMPVLGAPLAIFQLSKIPIIAYIQSVYCVLPLPNEAKWDALLEDMVQWIQDDYGSTNDSAGSEALKPSVFLLANRIPVRYHQLMYYNLKKQSPIHFVFKTTDGDPATEIRDVAHDYILMETDSELSADGENDFLRKVVAYLDTEKVLFSQLYKKVKTIDTVRGTQIVILKRSES